MFFLVLFTPSANAGWLKIDVARPYTLSNEALRLTTTFAFGVFTILCFVLEMFDNITSGEALFLTLLATFFWFCFNDCFKIA